MEPEARDVRAATAAAEASKHLERSRREALYRALVEERRKAAASLAKTLAGSGGSGPAAGSV